MKPTWDSCRPLRALVIINILSVVAGQQFGRLIEMEEYQPVNDPNAPYGTVWYNGTYLYLPSPPGKTPRCARGGMTYCGSIPTYPDKLISRLLVQWKYDLSTVFSSENRDTLTSTLAQNSSSALLPSATKSYTSRRQKPSLSFGQKSSAFTPRHQSGVASQTTRFGDVVSSRGEATNQNAYKARLAAAGVPYTREQANRRLVNDGGVFGHGQRTPFYSNENWGYSFSVNRQKRQTSGGNQLCPTVGQFVTPKAGLNNRGEWRYVINMGEVEEQYTQLVRAERCVTNACSGLCTIPAGMVATCEQQYVQKKMIGLDPSGSQMYTDLYWIPHCCVCQIR